MFIVVNFIPVDDKTCTMGSFVLIYMTYYNVYSVY